MTEVSHYYSDGAIAGTTEVTWDQHGKKVRNGKFTLYHHSGTTYATGAYVNDMLTGIVSTYDRHGTNVVITRTYLAGVLQA